MVRKDAVQAVKPTGTPVTLSKSFVLVGGHWIHVTEDLPTVCGWLGWAKVPENGGE